eukprot:scaffold7275_cov61-Phaeocystis_antarctica.AAC.9
MCHGAPLVVRRALACHLLEVHAEPRVEPHAWHGGGEEHAERALLRRGGQQRAVLACRGERLHRADVCDAPLRSAGRVACALRLDASDQRGDGRPVLLAHGGWQKCGSLRVRVAKRGQEEVVLRNVGAEGRARQRAGCQAAAERAVKRRDRCRL